MNTAFYTWDAGNLQFKKEDEVTELKRKSEWGIKKEEELGYSKEVRVVFNRQGI